MLRGETVLNSNSEFSRFDERREEPETVRPIRRSALAFVDTNVGLDILFAFELIAILGIGLASAEIYVAGVLGAEDYFREYASYLMLAPVLVGVFLTVTGCYRTETISRYSRTFDRLIRSVGFAFVALVAIGFVFGIDDDISRVWIAVWSVGSLVLLLLTRALASRTLADISASGVPLSTIAIYGDRRPSQNLISELQRSRPNARIVGVFGPSDERLASGKAPWSGDLDDLLSYGRSHRIDTIIIANSAFDPDAVARLLDRFSALPSEILVSFGLERSHIPIRRIQALEDSQLLEVQRKPIAGWGRLSKIALDYTVAGLAVLLLAPLMLMIALILKLDSKGPVLFKQHRHGFNQQVFPIWKFRTMTVMEDGDSAVQATRGDARVTAFGRILRRTSLDELPQLFNVLRGEMSIVGPRPHPMSLNSVYADLLKKYDNRLLVKPGITGWAQINGFRGPTEDPELMRQRVQLDLEYIENWSLWLDLKIIAATPFSLILGKNAV